MILSQPWCGPSHLCAHLGALPVRPQTVTALLTPASQTRTLGPSLHQNSKTHCHWWPSMQKTCAFFQHVMDLRVIAERCS